jgi:hypothetical protein
LTQEVEKYKEVAAKAYRRGDQESSYGILAEAQGAMEVLVRLLNAVLEVRDSEGKIVEEQFIFNKQDRKEAGYE